VNTIHRTRRARGAASGWRPAPGWGQSPGWGQLVDDDPLPLRAAGSVGRWLWPTLAVGSFLIAAGFVLGHDDPAPGLSLRGLLIIALAAMLVVLLTIRRAAGPGPLARAMVEYTVVALLAMLVATTGIDAAHPPAGTKQASTTPDHRPALVKTLDGFRDWLGEWREWARKETDRRTPPSSSTTTPEPKGDAMSPSPALPSSTRRPL
jgi:hypothetical protein